MKLSVIIPVCNAKNTIERLVNCILKCEEPEMEIILVDDGSSDGSDEVCDKLAKQDNRCRAIHKQNGGVSSARNAGINAANGDYIFFCDSDDCVFSDVLCEAIECLDAGVDLFLFDFIYHFINSGKTSKSSFKLKPSIVLNREYIINHILSPLVLNEGTDMATAWHKFFKRSIIEKYNVRFEENVYKGEDWRFVLDYLAVCETAFYIPKVLYEYRLDGSQCESKYKKSTGIHLLGSYKRKLGLNKKFQLYADETKVLGWYSGLIFEVVYSVKTGCKIHELRKMICDESVQESAKAILHTKNKVLMKNGISRMYMVYALLVLCRMPHLVRLVARRTLK